MYKGHSRPQLPSRVPRHSHLSRRQNGLLQHRTCTEAERYVRAQILCIIIVRGRTKNIRYHIHDIKLKGSPT